MGVCVHVCMYVMVAYGHGGVFAHVYVCHRCLWSWGRVCTCICMSWLLMVMGVCVHMYMYVMVAYGHGGVCAHVYVCHGCLWS